MCGFPGRAVVFQRFCGELRFQFVAVSVFHGVAHAAQCVYQLPQEKLIQPAVRYTNAARGGSHHEFVLERRFVPGEYLSDADIAVIHLLCVRAELYYHSVGEERDAPAAVTLCGEVDNADGLLRGSKGAVTGVAAAAGQLSAEVINGVAQCQLLSPLPSLPRSSCLMFHSFFDRST